MKMDKRGRVRFTYQGYRFELTATSFNIYRRYYWLAQEFGIPPAEHGVALRKLLDCPSGRQLLETALLTLRVNEIDRMLRPQYTTDIFIPKHMRAV